MGWWSKALVAGALGAALCGPPAVAGQADRADLRRLSAKAAELAQWVRASGDHRGRPFAIVDKQQARVHVFGGTGQWRGSSAILVGQAPGDHSAPGVGERAQSGRVPSHERTTPAGRFESSPGRNLSGEHVVWVDYDSAFAIHRLRPGPGLRERERRLASPDPAMHRVSLGCVVVPVAFYVQQVQPLLGRGAAVIYVLPERGSLREMLDSRQALVLQNFTPAADVGDVRSS